MDRDVTMRRQRNTIMSRCMVQCSRKADFYVNIEDNDSNGAATEVTIMTAERYIRDVLQEHVLQGRSGPLSQQDSAQPHIVHRIIELLE
ncbi:hypothetical protein BDFB_013505 [Asbolus verrucosus]|uniref:Uncharacterized protein n=1 Tax=Asbolus verrucosus TaxID=1661398 RepID=A0A482VUE2_ASBVE|nr:hypothetical protein BDFB_013505 [Asbolus verrucosus]